jgi:hypothetical protein
MAWNPAGPDLYRLSGGGAPAPAASDSGLSSLSTPSAGAAGEGKLLSLDNPLTVYLGAAALVFGLMAFSTSGSVRVGKTKLSGSLGVGNS